MKENFEKVNREINIFTHIKSKLYSIFIQPVKLKSNSYKKNRFLEIGPGSKRIENFETLNTILINQTDYIGKLGYRLPFKDNTFDIIYMSHVLEHTFWHKLDNTIEEIKRILKPEGAVEIWVPDALKIAQAFVDAEHGRNDDFAKNDGWFRLNPKKDPCMWFSGRMFAYGDQVTPINNGHYNIHIAAFTERFLKNLLNEHNFRNVRMLDRSECRGFDHGWINLGITGKK